MSDEVWCGQSDTPNLPSNVEPMAIWSGKSDFQINRCVKPKGFGKTPNCTTLLTLARTDMVQLSLKKCFWTDSKSVLKYIKREDQRFQTFHANRVTTVRDSSEVAQWQYIPTFLNPAEHASHGVKAENLARPEFLRQPVEAWPTLL